MRVFLVDYPLAASGHSIPPEKMQEKRRVAVSEIHSLLRTHKHLVHTKLVEDVIAIDNTIYLRVELELEHQASLPFQGDSPVNEILYRERALLTGEAMSLQQRINRIAVSLIANPSNGDLPSTGNDDSVKLLKLLKKYSGQSFKTRFHNDDLLLKFPEIPSYVFGDSIVLEVGVVRILEGNSIEFSMKSEFSSKKTKKYRGLCNFSYDGRDQANHMAIAYAKRVGKSIHVKARPVSRIGENLPSYYEIFDLLNFPSLLVELVGLISLPSIATSYANFSRPDV